jgi:hypothetical protein
MGHLLTFEVRVGMTHHEGVMGWVFGLQMWWFITWNIFCFLDFVLHVLCLSFSKSKGQVISHVMNYVTSQVMGQVHVTCRLTNASCAPTGWLSHWLSTKPWWLTTEDAIPICGYAYWLNYQVLMNLDMWFLFHSCIENCVCYPESPSWPLVVLGLR